MVGRHFSFGVIEVKLSRRPFACFLCFCREKKYLTVLVRRLFFCLYHISLASQCFYPRVLWFLLRSTIYLACRSAMSFFAAGLFEEKVCTYHFIWSSQPADGLHLTSFFQDECLMRRPRVPPYQTFSNKRFGRYTSFAQCNRLYTYIWNVLRNDDVEMSWRTSHFRKFLIGPRVFSPYLL